jgi:guanylate cyclase
LDVNIEVLSEKHEHDHTHAVFKLEFKNEQFIENNQKEGNERKAKIESTCPVNSEIFFDLFPFHLTFNRKMEIMSVGNGLSQAMKNIEGELVKDYFNLLRPLISFTWDHVCS